MKFDLRKGLTAKIEPVLTVDTGSIILILAIIIATIFLGYRTIENNRLKSKSHSLNSKIREMSGELAGPPTLQLGDIVPMIEAKNLRGEVKNVKYAEASKTLLFIFSAECSACDSQLPQWNNIAEKVGSNTIQVMGLAVNNPETVREKFNHKEMKFEVLMPNDFAIQRAFRTVALPLTVLVSAQGRVEWFSYGVLTEADRQKILSFSTL